MQLNVKSIKIKMIERGIESQAELAKLVGVHKQSLTNWFRGRNQPTLESVIAIADVLGCQVEDITYLRPKAASLPPIVLGTPVVSSISYVS